MTDALGRIGSEDWALRKVQNQTHATVAPATTTYKKPVPAGISTISSIAPSTAPAQIIPLRPKLEPPTIDEQLAALYDRTENNTYAEVKENYLWIILNLHNMVEEISGEHIKYISDTIRRDTAELDKLNEKKTEELSKYALEVENQRTWNVFSEIAKAFLSAATLVVGGLMIASGVASVAGAFMIASGGLGLADTILTHTGAYEAIASHFAKSREMQQNIAAYISGTVLFMALGCGLVGGVLGFLSNGFEAARAGMDLVRAGEKVQLTAAIATGAINVARTWSAREAAALQKVLQTIEGRIFVMKQDLQHRASEAKDALQIMQSITKQTHEIGAAI